MSVRYKKLKGWWRICVICNFIFSYQASWMKSYHILSPTWDTWEPFLGSKKRYAKTASICHGGYRFTGGFGARPHPCPQCFSVAHSSEMPSDRVRGETSFANVWLSWKVGHRVSRCHNISLSTYLLSGVGNKFSGACIAPAVSFWRSGSSMFYLRVHVC